MAITRSGIRSMLWAFFEIKDILNAQNWPYLPLPIECGVQGCSIDRPYNPDRTLIAVIQPPIDRMRAHSVLSPITSIDRPWKNSRWIRHRQNRYPIGLRSETPDNVNPSRTF
jgi:hypothetical protein